MRILELRFKNLNSLVGEWTIDFRDAAFASSGIFAITGPTGAGKSTILDALCLALYGRTPRLNRVNQSGNEVMSRQTGECFAEVTFEVQAGRFRCHWSQHRARKKTGGELQPPRQELVDATTGKVIANQLRTAAEAVEAATGMDFDRFTRSMLLAQGGFAAFLSASPDDRAPILEQITGTEIYSAISMAVHRRRAEEQAKLETLRAALAGLQPLGEDEENTLRAELARSATEESGLLLHGTQAREALAWTDGITALKLEVARLAAQQQALQARREEFSPDEKRLENALKALAIEPLHARLALLRGQQREADERMAELRAHLPGKEEAVVLRAAELQAATQQSDASKASQAESQPLLRKVRELDTILANQHASVEAAVAAVAAQQRTLDAATSILKAEVTSLGGDRAALTDVEAQLAVSAPDATLIADLTGITAQLGMLGDLHRQCHAKTRELEIMLAAETAARQAAEAAESRLKEGRDGLGRERQRLADNRAQLATVLAGRTLRNAREALDVLVKREALWARADDVSRAGAEANRCLGGLAEQHGALASEREKLQGALDATARDHEGKAHALELLRENLLLQQKVESLEEERLLLEDGRPCPLCGAESHPFAHGNMPRKSTTEASVRKAEADVRSLESKLGALRTEVAVNAEKLQTCAKERASTQRQLADASTRLREALAALGMVDGGGAQDKIQQQRSECAAAISGARATVEDAERLEEEGRRRQATLERQGQTLGTLELAASQAAHRAATAAETVLRVRSESDQSLATLGVLRASLLTRLRGFGIETLTEEALDGVQKSLAERTRERQAQEGQRQELGTRIGAREARIEQQRDAVETARRELGMRESRLAELRDTERSQQEWRWDLFADRKPDAEEARLRTATEDAEARRDAAQAAHQTAVTQRDRTAQSLQDVVATTRQREVRLRAAETEFETGWRARGFSGEGEFMAARLDERDRLKLERLRNALESERAELEASRREKAARLEVEQGRRLTEATREALVEEEGRIQEALRTVQQRTGAQRQRLSDNDALKLRMRDQVRQAEAQQRECARWNPLHELIGSADGKKYRNFAQGLTFELMVGHANQQLQRMSDRYVLTRNADEPLELSVIDNYQAGEVRSTKNLSGGESFIVSLALALGLSQMSSRKVRVDSLFLDEGFGTLDEDALETALDTLASLQEGGKLIGVISHVSALKERIGTLIQVTPRTGGRSTLAGPGCSRSSP